MSLFISECPKIFEGRFDEFFDKYVEPNLPTPERVAAFDALIAAYINTSDVNFIVRFSRGMVRGVRIVTDSGEVILPGDNSPGWWIHARLMDGQPFGTPAAFFESVPTHMFEIGKTRTLNKAGYHLAHILPVKDGNLNWSTWTRDELSKRFLLNIHPCNWFLLAHDAGRWRREGRRENIIEWVKCAYLKRYGELYQRFSARVGSLVPTDTAPAPRYDVGSVSENTAGQESSILPKTNSALTIGETHNDQKTLVFNRPLIRRRDIGTHKMLDLRLTHARYCLPHDELVAWVKSNTSACETRSWREAGVYSWPAPSRAMLAFLSAFVVEE